jgi:hypothetical protein
LAEFTIPYLESLSTGELIELAEKNGLDIPPDLERVFIIEELLYLENEDEEAHINDEAQGEINRPGSAQIEFREMTVLPKQYHISFLEVLIRDPLWAFVFWEIKAHDKEQCEKLEDFGGYCLRIIPLFQDTLQPNAAASFVVAIDEDDCARYLGFPPEDGPCFKIELCMLDSEDFTVLAESRPFKLPRLIEPKHDESVQAVYSSPLAQLSGVGSFSLVRSEDRLLRARSGE